MTVCWEKLWTDRQADIYKHADRHGNRQTDVQMRAKLQYLLLKAEFEKVIKVINLSVNLKSNGLIDNRLKHERSSLTFAKV